MFGFIVGTICLVFLLKVVFGHRHYGYHRRRHFYGGGVSPVAYGLLGRLGTTPGQEKVIREEWQRFADVLKSLRGEGKNTLADLADSLRGATLDTGKMDALFRRHDDIVSQLRKNAVESLKAVHATLDQRQRENLADLIAAGPWAFRHHHLGCGRYC